MNLDQYVRRLKKVVPRAGITAYLDSRPGTGYVNALVAVNAGAWRAPKGAEIIPEVIAEMLDEGTHEMSRDELRAELESLGTDVSFEVGGERLVSRIEMLRGGAERTWELVGSMLTKSAFEESSYRVVRERLLSEYREDEEDTRKLSYAGLTQLLYAKGSALRALLPQEKKRILETIDSNRVRTHASHTLRGDMIIVVVGDMTASELNTMLTRSLKHWNTAPGKTSVARLIPEPSIRPSHVIQVKEKENVDVYWGRTTDVRAQDSEFASLSTAVEMLGSGGFTGHLMKTVRDRDGLTYGIYARLRDTMSSLPLMAFVSATFGNNLYEKGVRATEREIEEWLATHITAKALRAKKEELRGSYLVSLEDPEDVAWRLLATVCSGRPLSEFATYPKRVQKLTVSEVRLAAKKWLTSDSFVRSSAGSIE